MYVVTGGAGFIGSNIVWALEERGLGPIVVIDRLHDQSKWRNLAKRELADMIPPEHTLEFLDANATTIDVVIHMGAISATTETDVDLIMRNNFHLSMELWRWCTAHNVRLIYASSAATYGDGSRGFDDVCSVQALAAHHPMNPYGWSKHLFDRRVARMIYEGNPCPPQWVGLKFFNVYGPNEYHKGRMQSVVAQVYPVAKQGGAARLFKSHHPDYEDGGQLRDFIWVGDCVDMVAWLLDHPKVNGLFNCGSGEARSFVGLADAVYAALDKPPSIEYIDTPEEIREKYQYFTEAKMNRLRAVGYDKPMTSLEDGISKYVRGFLDSGDPYR